MSNTNTLMWWCRFWDREPEDDDWVRPVRGEFGFVMVRP